MLCAVHAHIRVRAMYFAELAPCQWSEFEHKAIICWYVISVIEIILIQVETISYFFACALRVFDSSNPESNNSDNDEHEIPPAFNLFIQQRRRIQNTHNTPQSKWVFVLLSKSFAFDICGKFQWICSKIKWFQNKCVNHIDLQCNSFNPFDFILVVMLLLLLLLYVAPSLLSSFLV